MGIKPCIMNGTFQSVAWHALQVLFLKAYLWKRCYFTDEIGYFYSVQIDPESCFVFCFFKCIVYGPYVHVHSKINLSLKL